MHLLTSNTDSIFRTGKNSYPLAFLEECKYIAKKERCHKYITENSDEESFDEETSDEKKFIEE